MTTIWTYIHRVNAELIPSHNLDNSVVWCEKNLGTIGFKWILLHKRDGGRTMVQDIAFMLEKDYMLYSLTWL